MAVEDRVARYVRLPEVRRRDEAPSEEVSVLKLAVAELFQRVTDLLLEAAGE